MKSDPKNFKWSPKAQAAHRRIFLDALENGNFKQTRGKLMSNAGGVCCLGLACDVSGLGEWEKRDGEWYYVIRNKDGVEIDLNSSVLPEPVMNWLGFESDSGTYNESYFISESLTEDNDNKKHTFKRIAQTIRKKPAGLLTS